MANQVRLVITIVSLALLVSVRVMSAGRFKSLMTITGNGITGQKIAAVKQQRERIDEATVTYPTGDQHLREVDQCSRYQRRTVCQVEVGATDSENTGSGVSFRHRKLKPEFFPKRQIPGGPDGQHHESNGV